MYIYEGIITGFMFIILLVGMYWIYKCGQSYQDYIEDPEKNLKNGKISAGNIFVEKHKPNVNPFIDNNQNKVIILDYMFNNEHMLWIKYAYVGNENQYFYLPEYRFLARYSYIKNK